MKTDQNKFEKEEDRVSNEGNEGNEGNEASTETKLLLEIEKAALAGKAIAGHHLAGEKEEKAVVQAKDDKNDENDSKPIANKKEKEDNMSDNNLKSKMKKEEEEEAFQAYIGASLSKPGTPMTTPRGQSLTQTLLIDHAYRSTFYSQRRVWMQS